MSIKIFLLVLALLSIMTSASGSVLTSGQYKDGEMRVYYLTEDGHIHELASESDHSWYYRDVTSDSQAPEATFFGALSLAQYKDGEMRVYYLNGGDVHELSSWSDHSWHERDITSDSQAPAGTHISPLTSAQYKDGEMRVYYTSDFKHIHELASWSDHSWHERDITADSQAPADAFIRQVLTSAQYKDGEMRVYYLTEDGHIHELASESDHSWNHRDITADSQAPAAATDTRFGGLTSAKYIDGEMRVYYLTEDGHIHELASESDHSWYERDITADSQAPAAVSGSPLTSAQYKDGEMRVYYLTEDGNIHELASWSDHSWHHRDITADSQAPAAVSDSPLTSAQYEDGEMRVYYLTDDGFKNRHIHELASWSDHSWHNRDITTDSNAPAGAY